MSKDVLYNFNDKADANESLKLNMDELYAKKQQQDLNVLNNYNKILARIHNKIKYTSQQLINDQCCWYVMPEMMLGIPKYNCGDCCAYIIEKLRDNGFVVRYTHPNLLFIGWRHWVPSYVRNEIKKKTGQIVDEYGNLVTKDKDNDNDNAGSINNNTDSKINNLMFNQTTAQQTAKKNDYKDIKSYKPSGSLIYSNNLLKKLDILGE